MDLVNKKLELIKLIEDYLNKNATLDDLQNFAWDVIHYFNKTEKSKLPANYDFERAFWYGIWEIQHLADTEHEADGLTEKVLKETLDYLNNKKETPPNIIGRRP